MKKKLLSILFFTFSVIASAQTISIVGTGVNGWPPNLDGPEITLSTTDNVTYTISNLLVSTGEVKFRQDFDWAFNWGGSTFPSGQGILNSLSDAIPSQAGIYDITFNRNNGTYSFIGNQFPSIGIWGPAVNSQLGFGAPDVDMLTTDGINYTLSGFNFSSGTAYFRQDNASEYIWGSVGFPTGTAVLNGPTISVTGGEWLVSFNRISGEYSFNYNTVGLIGSATSGDWFAETAMNTTNGVLYSLSDVSLTVGEVKFRQNSDWNFNWGSNDTQNSFPSGTGAFNSGGNILIPAAGTYNVTFNKETSEYSFLSSLGINNNSVNVVTIYPNPANEQWNLSANEDILSVELYNILGKKIISLKPNQLTASIEATALKQGIYFATITTEHSIKKVKLIKE